MDLSIIIPSINDSNFIPELLPRLNRKLSSLLLNYEIIVVDNKPGPKTCEILALHNAKLISPEILSYGSAIIAGINKAHGEYIITMDSDLSHPAEFIENLWENRQSAEIIIASRYIPGGKSIVPFSRFIFSRLLNLVFSRGLDLKIKDMSSGYRLYKRKAIQHLELTGKNFNVLQEILVKTLAEGYRILEIPFAYEPLRKGSSLARIIQFGSDYLQTFSKLWLLRNSINCADYDSRAYDSWVIIQRYWQRQRYKHIINLSQGLTPISDIGCGSSRILEGLPKNSVGLDISAKKLRYASRYDSNLVQGSGLKIPFIENAFSCVICSQVIEHIVDDNILNELDRILKPGGILILGTPDYAKWQWRITEWFYGKLLPQAYADEHVRHYTLDGLLYEFITKRGYKFLEKRYILSGELILSLQKY